MSQDTEDLKFNFSIELMEIGKLSLCFPPIPSKTMELWESLTASLTAQSASEPSAQAVLNLCLTLKPSLLMHVAIVAYKHSGKKVCIPEFTETTTLSTLCVLGKVLEKLTVQNLSVSHQIVLTQLNSSSNDKIKESQGPIDQN